MRLLRLAKDVAAAVNTADRQTRQDVFLALGVIADRLQRDAENNAHLPTRERLESHAKHFREMREQINYP